MSRSSSYPGQIDSDVELPRVDDNVTEMGSDAINAIRDAIFTIEEVIGVNPQGNLQDLVTRINLVIDDNGALKTSALSTKGLVTLPIADTHVGDNAAIKESKLDLDYNTAYLNSRITGSNLDIDAIRQTFNAFVSRTLKHFSGQADKHDGYDVNLNSAIRSSDDIETAMHVINNLLTEHLSASNAHIASYISVSNEFENFSASNVQSALVELDKIGSGKLERHQDFLHTNAVGLNKKGEQGNQGNLKETGFASTIFQTETTKATNILQVMRPNVARITSKNLDLGAIKTGESSVLRVQAGGIGRSYLDIDLSAIIPVTDLDTLVNAINTTAHGCTYHYPISAYNTGGKLTIAHNIPGEEFTIQILDTVQFSAASALGFGDITSTVFTWSNEDHAGYIGGYRVKDFRTLIKKHHTHGSKDSNIIYLGLGNLQNYGLNVGNEGRVICNITNHSSNSEDNGSHYIIAYPNEQTIAISSDISGGTFDIEIVADSVNFENSANGELYDIFLENYDDGYGVISKYNRASYGPLSAVHLRTISKDFPTQNVEWQVSDSSNIQLLENDFGGVTTNIPTGFQGSLKVYAPDNINSAIFEVTGVPGNGKRNITVSNFAGSNDKLYLSSVHYGGNYGLYTLKFVTDKRQLGGSVENKSEDTLDMIRQEETTKELRNNGIIRGLDIVSSDTSTIKVRGGKALVDGQIVNVETQNVEVAEFGAAKRLLMLDKAGKFIIKSEYDAGYSFSELTAGDAYGDDRGLAIIAEFETNGSSIDGYLLDRRLMVSNVDKRLLNIKTNLEQRITQVENTVSGSMWGFTVAKASGAAAEDGYLASLEVGNNHGFSYIPSEVGWWDQKPTDARGFLGGQSIITTRRFEFSDPDTIATTIFRAPGLTHINVFAELIYTGNRGGPFGVTGTAYIELGIAVELGITNLHVYEEYARVKTILTGVLPSNSVLERYVASIPTSQLSLNNDVMFDVVPRVRIINSNFVDGGTGDDPEPLIKFDHIRIVTSSYSVAGHILEQDGASQPLAAKIGEVL